jgi:hypothetical protein
MKDVKTLLQEIAGEFSARPLDNSGEFSNFGASYLEVDSFRSGTQGKTWQELDWTWLKSHHDAVHFLTPRGVAEYLPAFLSAALAHYNDMDVAPRSIASVLTRPDADDAAGQSRFDEISASLTDGQRRIVAAALEQLAALSGDDRPEEPARRALASFWHQHLAEA